jgi:glycosyltransferase involved in cell wall biosynthesis
MPSQWPGKHGNRKIRVLQVITRLIVGGAQETVMLIADMLDKDRYQVEIVSGPQTGPEGSLIEEIRRRGIPLTILPDLVRQMDLRDFRAFWRLYGIMKSGRYDIVHTNSSKAGILGRWAARLAKIPVIVHTVHGWGHHKGQQTLVRRMFIWSERVSAATTDKLVVVSPRNMQTGLEDHIGFQAKYVTIRSGIELDDFAHPRISKSDMRARLGIGPEVPVVGTVTRLSPQKAPLDFVKAAIEAANRVPASHFVIVGDGPLRGQVETMINQSGLQQRFHLTGLRRDVPELLASFNVFVLTSLWEGLPRVLPQAMAAGLPIVATAVDGNAEAVRNGENGILVRPGDCEGLARAIEILLSDRSIAEQMGSRGRQDVSDFSDRKMVNEIDALYQSLVGQTR